MASSRRCRRTLESMRKLEDSLRDDGLVIPDSGGTESTVPRVALPPVFVEVMKCDKGRGDVGVATGVPSYSE